MKLVVGIGKAFGGFVLLVTAMAFITAISLFVVGAWLTSWPILRLAPSGRRKQAVMNVAVSLFTLAQAFAPENPPEQMDDDAPNID